MLKNRTPVNRLSLSLAAFGTLVLIAMIFVLRSHSFQVGYHKQRMKEAWKAMHAEPDIVQDGLVGYSQDEDDENYAYHRQRLVELGQVRKVHYRFQHIKAPSDESAHIFRRLYDFKPELIHFQSVHPNSPAPMELSVWVEVGHDKELKKFLRESDVPDYQKSFMIDGIEDEPEDIQGSR